MTPIQPQLAESNLFLISSGGPGGLSFNEFNPIFNRNGITAQAGSVLGEHDTYAGEGIISGIYQKAAFSIGGLHYTTDGWRKNADQKDDIANAFLQYELSPQTSIQGEYRYRNSDRGDLQLRFFPADLFPGRRNDEERHTYRFGIRHSLSPSSILLGSFMYQDASFKVSDNQLAPPATSFGIKRPEDAFSGEIQHLFRSRLVNLASGVGYFDIDSRVDTSVNLFIPPPDGPGPITIADSSSTDLQHTNIYSYAYLSALKHVTFTIGFSTDFVRSVRKDVGDKDQFNPKFGMTWEPFPGTTVRAAAFRTLKRTLVTNQTLEPTQVAGFNQFYDDFNGTNAWRYGGAIDQKLSRNIFSGVEFSRRELTVPYLSIDDVGNPVGRKADADEYWGRSYFFWTPHEWLALRAEYVFEQFKSDVPDFPDKLTTHRVPLGFSFFHPSGVGAFLTTTYWNQGGKNFARVDGSSRSGNDDFWTVDTALNYRLPKRYGFITIGATNLFDEKFRFFETDINNPRIQPNRMFFARVTLALPFGQGFEQ